MLGRREVDPVLFEEEVSATPPVEVPLLLEDGGTRHRDHSPAAVGFGVLQMASWQIVPVAADPVNFAGLDIYLIKINYDLLIDTDPEAPVYPGWFEIGFALADAEADEPITVIDAIPASIETAQQPQPFTLDRFLAFTTTNGAATTRPVVQLPAIRPRVILYGLGSSNLRWRHSAANGSGVRPGTYTSWTTLTVPGGCTHLTVEIAARFDFAPDSEFAAVYTPAPQPATVRVALTTATSAAAVTAGKLAPTTTTSRAVVAPAPRVFVSYAHDTPDHCRAVLRLSESLVENYRLDVHMDRWDLDRRRDWSAWATKQVTSADFVIIVASPRCKLVGDSQVDNFDNRGLQYEMALFRELLQTDRDYWLPKLLPVVLPGRSVSEIPLFLQPQTADHFLITDYSREGINDLIRVIIGRPPYLRPGSDDAPEQSQG